MHCTLFYEYVFVVLLYRNMKDISELIESQEKLGNTKVKTILVNAFFDSETSKLAKKIAEAHDCDFISIENKGYSYGNNVGISYAIDHYNFEYLIVANPDTIIQNFDCSVLMPPKMSAIYAPNIITYSGKKQNPNWVFKNEIIEKCQYLACKKDNVFLYYSAIGILKVQRIIFNAIDKVCKFKLHKIYCAHGCFVIFSKQAIFDLVPIYDEKMFLFYEEEYLARRAYLKKLPIYYTSDIQIKHKEDGSMKIANINQRKEAHKSIIYYYENRMKFL